MRPIDVWMMDLHVAGWIFQFPKANLTVKRMRIFGDKIDAPQALHVWMLQNRLHHPQTQPLALIGIEHVYIAKIGEGGLVRDDACKTYLFVAAKKAKAERVLNCTFYGLAWNFLRPISNLQGSMYRGDVHLSRVCRKKIFVVRLFKGLPHEGQCSKERMS